jgi:hypothetical protein
MVFDTQQRTPDLNPSVAAAPAAHPLSEYIESVDLRFLGRPGRWPIMRIFAPRFVEQLALGAYMRELLHSGQWSIVSVEPVVSGEGQASAHQFNVYGKRTVER